MLNSLSDLHGYVDKGELTRELGGSLEYCHSQWIHHRTVSSSECSVAAVETMPYPASLFSTGHRELCHDSENHSPDVTEVWNGPGRDGAAQWRPVHQGPVHSPHRQTQQSQGASPVKQPLKQMLRFISIFAAFWDDLSFMVSLS